jgi:hypothetical protein
MANILTEKVAQKSAVYESIMGAAEKQRAYAQIDANAQKATDAETARINDVYLAEKMSLAGVGDQVAVLTHNKMTSAEASTAAWKRQREEVEKIPLRAGEEAAHLAGQRSLVGAQMTASLLGKYSPKYQMEEFDRNMADAKVAGMSGKDAAMYRRQAVADMVKPLYAGAGQFMTSDQRWRSVQSQVSKHEGLTAELYIKMQRELLELLKSGGIPMKKAG